MILRLEQTARLPERKHTIKYTNGDVFCYASVKSIFHAEIEMQCGKVLITTNNVSHTTICCDDQIVGSVEQKLCVTKKVLFLPIGYEYEMINFMGNDYKMYESGLGKDQHYFSIYKGEDLIAVIHKDDKVVNYLNTYALYSLDESEINIAIICAMYLESTEFCDRTGGIGNSVIDSPYYSSQKELRDKYDPTFIPRIKAMEHNSQ